MHCINLLWKLIGIRPPAEDQALRATLLRGIEIACCLYLSPAKRSFSGSSAGIRDWIRE